MVAPVSIRKNPKLFPIMKLAGIIAPVAFWQASPVEKAAAANGCGPGGWLMDLVPDTLHGLIVTDVCNIHDWYYFYGLTTTDKIIGDKLFRFNLRSKIRMCTEMTLLCDMRLHLAETYYRAVHEHGYNAFFAGKAIA